MKTSYITPNYSLLSVSTPIAINIGDYIQALAARQFLPYIDSFIEREFLDSYEGEYTNVIMNAYYMHDGTHWPPSPKINPLYVAVHINILAKDLMLSPEGISYFKKYQPIGCRDKETERLLKKHGISAYFSGCLTLTLGNTYKTTNKNNKVYFVDVKLPLKNKFEKISLLLKSVFCNKDIKNIYFRQYDRFVIEKWCQVAKFYFKAKTIIDKDLLLNGEYRTQEDKKYNFLPDNNARLKAAEELVKEYAEASLVITTRIHCALPCLAIDTPVYYVYDDRMPSYSSCRLDGLVQLFNIIHWTGNCFKHDKFNSNNKIKRSNILPNKSNYIKYAEALSWRCREFVEKTKSK